MLEFLNRNGENASMKLNHTKLHMPTVIRSKIFCDIILFYLFLKQY
jgi:hypothetical protein